MNADDRARLCRVRCLVLAGIQAAGGQPAAWQVVRALRPVLGASIDLGIPPGPAAPIAAAGERAAAVDRQLERSDQVAPASPAGAQLGATVEAAAIGGGRVTAGVGRAARRRRPPGRVAR